jgi:hypothetical protein
LTARVLSVATLVLLLVLTGVGVPARPAHALSQAPAASYVIVAAVDLDKDTVTVSETVQYRNVLGVPLDSLVFRVVPSSPTVIDIGRIVVDGQPTERRLDGSVLELPLASPLAPGASTNVSLAFTLHVPNEPGRLTATAHGMTLGSWFPLLAVHREDWDRRQFVEVGDAIFSEVADYDVTISTTTPAQIVATGQRVEQDGKRSRFKASSVRDFAAAISADYVVKQSTVTGVTVEVAAYSEDRAAYFASRAADFLRWAGDKLGAYPYPVLTIADTDLPAAYGGLEYPSMALISRAYGVGSPPEGSALDSLLLHEIVHQWFYSLVGNDQIADPWLDEAFATYVTYSYYREIRPDLAPAVYDRTIAGNSAGYVNTTVYDYSADGPYFGVVYRRGARFLERLHDALGDSAFWALMHEHVDTYRDRIASSRAFLDRAQSLTNTSLGPLISQYFSYGAFSSATPRAWTLDAPVSPWTGSAALTVGADFPIARVQVWLDQRLLADGAASALTLDLTGVEAGSYVLLVRLWDPDGVLFERVRRIEVVT